MSDVDGSFRTNLVLTHSVSLPSATTPTLLPALDAPPLPAVTIFPRDESDQLIIPHSACTHDGFREWALSDNFPKFGKLTFIEGEIIVDMSPESIEEHSAVKSEVSRVLLALVREYKLGQMHIDGVLISNKAAGVSNEPDILFVSKAALKSGRVQFTPAVGRPQSSKEIVGAVDWVLEIISPSSRRKDARLLRDSYYKAGIREYWLIDALGEEIDFQILVAGPTAFVPVKAKDGWRTSPAFGRLFRLTRERDEDGYWQYTLHMQEKP